MKHELCNPGCNVDSIIQKDKQISTTNTLEQWQTNTPAFTQTGVSCSVVTQTSAETTTLATDLTLTLYLAVTIISHEYHSWIKS